MDAAMQPAHDAHELSHAFSSQARAWLALQSTAVTAASDDAMPGMEDAMADFQLEQKAHH